MVDSAGRNHNRVCEGQTECVLLQTGAVQATGVCVCVCVRVRVCVFTGRGLPSVPLATRQSKPRDNATVGLVIH